MVTVAHAWGPGCRQRRGRPGALTPDLEDGGAVLFENRTWHAYEEVGYGRFFAAGHDKTAEAHRALHHRGSPPGSGTRHRVHLPGTPQDPRVGPASRTGNSARRERRRTRSGPTAR
ncbi:hypothetical protein SAM23877_0284 [Streptomyces ambofaciens ATCC 23877]|uniref:Uncharacterized protein n=1 Tax=Streptomyces ambofaciens (strain ATCC 23877 / 3486 / DSM 40053 / JCM 4204 / NBRC 12836 / NRRL B-2516) TaxID=278992 RepID=A0A0K2AJY9_STRA7|nr:hypothetical protein SAM23877_0284 [Streptomyces ambofaciens ATCC 23877]